MPRCVINPEGKDLKMTWDDYLLVARATAFSRLHVSGAALSSRLWQVIGEPQLYQEGDALEENPVFDEDAEAVELETASRRGDYNSLL